MSIELSILPHQENFLKAIRKTFNGVEINHKVKNYQNPIIDLFDNKLNGNISELWKGYDGLNPIPKEWQTKDNDDYLGLDIRMETGTGKTYCYTRMMYELNQLYGFHKFIILVPTISIREGSKSFLQAEYSKRHFADIYPNKNLSLSILEAGNSNKMFPNAVAEFARGNSLEKNKFSVLLMTSGMLTSSTTMGRDYDQTILDDFTQPYQTLRETRPIVIIDEPHRFKKENKAYKKLIKEINPQCVIRFGATFPDKRKSKLKDYNNLIFNLGPKEAFNQNLVKGIETYMIDAEKENETKLKLMSYKGNPKVCTFRDETSNISKEIKKDNSLAIFGEDFADITIKDISTKNDDFSNKGVTLSNGQVLSKGDIVYGGIYTKTYQEFMIEQSIKNHIETEKENFLRGNKIKTLSLYFIDSVRSYREEEGKPGNLRLYFEDILNRYLKEEIKNIKHSSDQRELEYLSYLQASLKDISKTNGGYFSEDNSKNDEDIQNEVDKILREKEHLLSFKDESGNWNTMRFIFSKWTLREGWDNPNVFQITKLRSSGSEISKLQEVGRGLRLPVDEKGRRISDEQFYLKYLIDYSEKDFASKLLGEINSDISDRAMSINDSIEEIAKLRNITANDIFMEMLSKGYVDYKGTINKDKLDDVYSEYPEFFKGLKPDVVRDGTKKKNYVKIRKDKFTDINKLWNIINRKYYLKIDDIKENELIEALINALNKDIYRDTTIDVIKQKSEIVDNEVYMNEYSSDYFIVDGKIAYSDFLKIVNIQTAVPINTIHKALCQYSDKYGNIDNRLFSKVGINLLVREFNNWLDDQLLKKFSYKALDIKSKETSLTNYKGEVLDHVSQGILGIHRDDKSIAPDKYIYDSVVFDSPKEKDNIMASNMNEIVVFGKIPRSSIQIPLFTGGTTSPDFMYVIKTKNDYEINFIVETKDMKDESGLRQNEVYRIESAKKFFETLKNEGLNVIFKKQFKHDDIVAMIKGLPNK